MAKIDDVKLSKVRSDGKAEIIFRLYVTKTFSPQFRSGLFINPERFIQPDRNYRDKDGKERVRGHLADYEISIPRKGRMNLPEVKELTEINSKFSSLQTRLIKICDTTAEKHDELLNRKWIEEALRVVNKYNIPDDDISFDKIVNQLKEEKKQEEEEEKKAAQASQYSFFDHMIDFRDNAKKKVNGKREGDKSDVWKKNFDVLVRALRRYEMFVRLSDKERKNFTLDINTISSETLSDIESYLRNEHSLLEEYPKIFEKIPASTDSRRSPKPQPRGNNTICALFNKLKAFFNWLNEKNVTANMPFKGFDGVKSEKYGTPYYITLEERNTIADFDLSEHPQMEIQRDIFIFQCCIGCRVSDLLKLTQSNVINGAIEYIPLKTKGERQNVVRVPLNNRASTLMKKYKGVDSKGRLFPFIAAQNYNDSIKEIFRLCGITRAVTVINSITGKEEQRPINEVASSHMARRTFVGNLYKKVKDPSLISSMSGHAEGSKAFNRYRVIDDEIKKEAVTLME